MGTTNSLKELGKSQCWVMDGTFYVVPKLFRQLFTIQGFIDGQSVPLIFCLMSKKSKQAYNEFFHQLFHLALDQNINLNPQRIITDFEQTISSVAQQFFPDALYKGCLFHFGQIIWRQVQKEKLAQKYGNNEMFSISIRMLKSLSFVPPENVLEYYNELNDSNNDKDFKKISAWFKQNYIRSTRKSGAPKYSPNFWCVSDGFHDNFPRTSNSIEAWHRRLKIIVGKKCGVYEIIKELKKEYIEIQANIDKIHSGISIRKNEKNIYRRKHIKKVVKARGELDKITYLRSISHSLSLCN